MKYTHSTEEISKILDLSKKTILYWVKNNKISSEKRGIKRYFSIEEVEEFLNNKRGKKENSGIKCKICGEVTKYKSWSTFTLNHLKNIHGIDSKEYYDKFIATEEERYCKFCGKEKSFKSPERGYFYYCSDNKCRAKNYDIQEKIENKKIEIYGDKHYTNREKGKKTRLEKYGDENYTNRKKAVETTIKRHGTTNMFKVPELNEKREITCLEKYGVKRFVNPEKISFSHQKNYLEKIKKYLDENDKEILDYKTNNIKFKCGVCGNITETNIKLLYSRVIENKECCLHCNPLKSFNSSGEDDIKKILSENKIKFLKNDREVLEGKELDIFIPEKNLAIEFNGCFWHSTTFKDRNYHKNKTEMCRKKGIQLLHIFEDQWNYKKDLVISFIKNKIGLNQNKIYARLCEIKLVGNTEKEIFLEENHLQGNCKSKVNIGLYFNGVLVSLMCFGKSRYKKYDKELLRFCSLKNYNVLGAASRLFKYFIENYEYNNIVSYSDKTYSYGEIYNLLGFQKTHESDPSYFYVRKKDLLRFNRFLLNKNKLNIPKEITEEEYLTKDYFKIFNSGNIVFLYKK